MPSVTKLFTLALTGAIASGLSLDTAARAASTVTKNRDPAKKREKLFISTCYEEKKDKNCYGENSDCKKMWVLDYNDGDRDGHDTKDECEAKYHELC